MNLSRRPHSNSSIRNRFLLPEILSVPLPLRVVPPTRSKRFLKNTGCSRVSSAGSGQLNYHLTGHGTVRSTCSLGPHYHVVKSEYIEEALKQEFIHPSTFPAASSCLFIGKKDPCIDYRALNSQTVKFQYPLPFVPTALEQL